MSSKKSVDDVWREISQQPKKEEMTLEYFLFKAEEAAEVKQEMGRGRPKRCFSLSEPPEKAAELRERRMIKNREAPPDPGSAAFEAELESMVVRLEEENHCLLKEKVIFSNSEYDKNVNLWNSL